MAETDPAPYSPPPVQNRAAKPPGILPRNTQARVIGGVSLLMVIVIAFSGRKESKQRNASNQLKAPAVIDPNEARIQEYRSRIEEQARKLTAEQAQLDQSQRKTGPA